MSKIPEVLKAFVETHEESGKVIKVCDPQCGATVLAEIGWRTPGPDYRCVVRWLSRAAKYCEKCGTLVGFTGPAEEEVPYRVRYAKLVESLAHRDRALRLATRMALPFVTEDEVDAHISEALAATEEEA